MQYVLSCIFVMWLLLQPSVTSSQALRFQP